MDDLVKFLRGRNMADNHAYAEVARRFGADALLDSHLPMLDLVDMLARDYQAMDPADRRHAGLAYALKALAQSYAEHPHYRQEWRPWAAKDTAPTPDASRAVAQPEEAARSRRGSTRPLRRRLIRPPAENFDTYSTRIRHGDPQEPGDSRTAPESSHDRRREWVGLRRAVRKPP